MRKKIFSCHSFITHAIMKFASQSCFIKGEYQKNMFNEINFDQMDLNAAPPSKEPERQYYFIARCREWVKDFQKENGRLPRACVFNMGCQMNR